MNAFNHMLDANQNREQQAKEAWSPTREPYRTAHQTASCQDQPSLGLVIVAECVETEAQITQLKRLECDIVQGYYFSKPLSPRNALITLAITPCRFTTQRKQLNINN